MFPHLITSNLLNGCFNNESHPSMQLFQIPGNAQAKIEDVSRLLLNQVSQMPSKMPSSLKQVTTANNQPLANMSKKLAVRFRLRWSSTHVSLSVSFDSRRYRRCRKNCTDLRHHSMKIIVMLNNYFFVAFQTLKGNQKIDFLDVAHSFRVVVLQLFCSYTS